MKKLLTVVSLSLGLLAAVACATDKKVGAEADTRSSQEIMFEDGNYAMFIHFGLYSHLEGVYKDSLYFGGAEWIMHPNLANIPREEYMAMAGEFNPCKFDADAIVNIAKEAGMKYIVITSKHHEGFAMFDSDVCDFNIHDATPVKRDFMAELADACHRNGLGIGFYYSQFQDWTAPGGAAGPKTDENGNEVTFDDYFYNKCVPQVRELLTKYGEIELIWFDTPRKMLPKYSEELVKLVHELQPGTLVSSRVGNGLGDFETLGDMEAPIKNIDKRWEGIDVTQLGWGYSRIESEWKSPYYIVNTLVSNIARGGTFMMNVGPTSEGLIAPQAQYALLNAGKWIKKYPEVVYAAGPSPWGHALPWGDAVTQDGKIYLVVWNWPENGELWLHGLKSDIRKARLYDGKKLKFRKEGSWICLKVPFQKPDKLASVIELDINGDIMADEQLALDPVNSTDLPVVFAETDNCAVEKEQWIIRTGEWHFKHIIKNIKPEAAITWTVDVKEAGWYDVAMDMFSNEFSTLELYVDGQKALIDMQKAPGAYTWRRLGWVNFDAPGVHTLTLKPVDVYPKCRIASIRLTPVKSVE